MHQHQINRVPITSGGGKIIGIRECCTIRDCNYEKDLPLNQYRCPKCNAIIKYFDTQDLNESINKHNLTRHRALYFQNNKNKEAR